MVGTDLTAVNATPAAAAPEESRTGRRCGWTDGNRTSPTWRTNTNPPDLGSLTGKPIAHANNSSLFVCGHENRDHDLGNGYRAHLPDIFGGPA